MEMNWHYLDRSFERLGKWIPFKKEILYEYYRRYGRIQYEDTSGYHYCLFSWPELDTSGNEFKGEPSPSYTMERIIILVFDNEDQIIADLSAMHGNIKDYLGNKKLLDYLCDDGDWSYLEHYTMTSCFFPELPYPPCEYEGNYEYEGEFIELNNAYVTKVYRRQGIFTSMMEMLEDFLGGDKLLYEVMSLDPDVACYGPDSSNVPYIYNYDIDEPVREINAQIVKKLGFVPLKLEDDDPSEEDDGTKLWFALKRSLIYELEDND